MTLGAACTYKIVGCLLKKYESPEVAESTWLPSGSFSSTGLSSMSTDTQPTIASVGVQADVVNRTVQCQTTLSLIPTTEQNQLADIANMFTQLMSQQGIIVPTDYLQISAMVMKHLAGSGHSNVLYKRMGTMRKDGSDSCLPCKRMPMGLLE